MSLLLILVLCLVGMIAVPVFLTLGLAVWIVKLVLQLVFLPVSPSARASRLAVLSRYARFQKTPVRATQRAGSSLRPASA
jgi:hypothetical protein